MDTSQIDEPEPQFTAMQTEVLKLAALGKGRMEIAEALLISPSAVRSILKHIALKLQERAEG